jgi:hypothetical protein
VDGHAAPAIDGSAAAGFKAGFRGADLGLLGGGVTGFTRRSGFPSSALPDSSAAS